MYWGCWVEELKIATSINEQLLLDRHFWIIVDTICWLNHWIDQEGGLETEVHEVGLHLQIFFHRKTILRGKTVFFVLDMSEINEPSWSHDQQMPRLSLYDFLLKDEGDHDGLYSSVVERMFLKRRGQIFLFFLQNIENQQTNHEDKWRWCFSFHGKVSSHLFPQETTLVIQTSSLGGSPEGTKCKWCVFWVKVGGQ